jgi:hypothetical protein
MTELQVIRQKIFEIRGKKVMLDFDLAELYDVETRILNQAVKRNMDRFPEDFMFQLNQGEWQRIRGESISHDSNSSQIVMSSLKHRGQKYLPYAFTEQGVAMLSSVLRSSKAIQVNITIMRTFVLIREYALTFAELAQRIAEMESNFDQKFEDVYEVLRELLSSKNKNQDWEKRKRIGFK